MHLPHTIQTFISERPYTLDETGMSGSKILCFDDMVLKIEAQSEESDCEHKMMAWLADKLPVPKILCLTRENGMNYLLMSRLEGEMACAEAQLADSKRLVALLAEGLRMLWRVDTADCPCRTPIEYKLKLAQYRVESGLCDMLDAEPETYGGGGFKNPAHLLQWLKENKPVEDFVFSHGDYCLPNVFIKDDKVSGFVDLGRSGVGDRYQDIALCYRSLKHNYEGAYGGRVYPDFDADTLFDELKIAPDWDKIRYYILLDELF